MVFAGFSTTGLFVGYLSGSFPVICFSYRLPHGYYGGYDRAPQSQPAGERVDVDDTPF